MNSIDYLIIAVYLIGMLALGWRMRRQNDPRDYFLGGRSFGWAPLTLSVMATQLSAVSFISAPAFVGLREGGGLVWLSYELAVPLAMLFLLAVVAPALHRSGVISVYDYLERRFDASSRLLLSFVFQLSRSFATGIMIYALSIILQGTMGLAPWQSILLIGVSTVIYSLQGGMKAVVYGDAIQMVVIVAGAAACLLFGLHALGGWDALWQSVDRERLTAFKFDSFGFDGTGFGFWPMLFGGLVLYASYYGCDQSEAQRTLSARDETQLRRVLLANGGLRFWVTLLYCMAGLVIGTLAATTPDFLAKIPADKPDWMMPVFIIEYLPAGMVGLLIVAIMAAAMSSLSSAVNSLSAVSVEDYARLSGRVLKPEQYLSYAKITAVAWGVVTLVLSVFAGKIAPTVIEAINLVGSIFYGPILALFALAVLSKRMRPAGANAGLLIGVLVNVLVWAFLKDVFWFWYNAIGFVTTLAIAYAVELMRAPAPETGSPDQHKLHLSSLVGPREAALMAGAFALIVAIGLWFNALAGR